MELYNLMHMEQTIIVNEQALVGLYITFSIRVPSSATNGWVTFYTLPVRTTQNYNFWLFCGSANVTSTICNSLITNNLLNCYVFSSTAGKYIKGAVTYLGYRE